MTSPAETYERLKGISRKALTPDIDLSNEFDLLLEVRPGSVDFLAQKLISVLTEKSFSINIFEDARSSGGYLCDSITNGRSTRIFPFGKVYSGERIDRLRANNLATEEEEVSFLMKAVLTDSENRQESRSDILLLTYGDVTKDSSTFIGFRKRYEEPIIKKLIIPDDLSLNEKRQFISHQTFQFALGQLGSPTEEKFLTRYFNKEYFAWRQEFLKQIAGFLDGRTGLIALAESMTGGHLATAFCDVLTEGNIDEIALAFSNIVYNEESKIAHGAVPFLIQGNNTYTNDASMALALSAKEEHWRQSGKWTGVFAGNVGLANVPDLRPGFENHRPGEFYFTIFTPLYPNLNLFVQLPVPEVFILENNNIDEAQITRLVTGRLKMKELATLIFLYQLYSRL